MITYLHIQNGAYYDKINRDGKAINIYIRYFILTIHWARA